MARPWRAGAVLALAVCLWLVVVATPPEPTAPSPTAGQTGAGAAETALTLVADETGPDETGPDETGADEAPARRRVDVLLTGDVLLHEGLWATARTDGGGAMDFRPLLSGMRDTVSNADLAICHLETPLATPGGPFSAYPMFDVPPQIAPALRWAGYDACTTASNHSVDAGFDGIVRTAAALDRAGLAHTGTYATKRASNRPLITEVDGVRVGLVAATYGLNGLPLPTDAPWSVDLLDVPDVLARAHAAREAGADVVLVALHWGVDGQPAVTEDQRRVARQLAASPDVDLVYGHHAHVVQSFERVGRTWVLFGLGNAIAQQDPAQPALYEGVAAQVRFVERRDGGFRVARVRARPTLTTTYGGAHPMRYLDVRRALRDPAWADLRPRLAAARDAVLARVWSHPA